MEQKMQHLLTKLAAAAIGIGAAMGADQAQAGPLPNLNNVASETSQAAPVEKAGYYRYRYGHYPYYRPWRPYQYWHYRPRYYGYGYYKPWRYGYWPHPYYRYRW